MSALLEKLRGELVDIIEWMDHTRDTLVWRFPRFRNQIKNGAQLIVRPGQLAVFVHRGRLADVFEPGQYALVSDNLPILSTLQGWSHGFDSPFKSEVYFVNTCQVTDLKWGTPNPIILRDAEFGPVRLRAFGTYTLKAIAPAALLQELVGTGESLETDEINELTRSVIHSSLADLLGKCGIAAMDLAANYRSLSEKLRLEVAARMAPEYGLDVPQLFIVNISLPEAVEQALDTRTSMTVIGDLNRFQQYQAGQATLRAASNPSGVAAAGVGMGVGMALGQSLSSAPALRTPPGGGTFDGSANAWHVAVEGQSQGPFTVEQLRDGVRQGWLSTRTLVWAPGMSSWTPAGQAPALAAQLSLGPPPPPKT